MSQKRVPEPPPQIAGYENPTLLGTGGFSDVFLYEQQRPRRRVAVKVLLHDLTSEDARARFDSEADLMAQLSTHPSIVTIYEADIASDGRPYLAMEYCSRPSLGATYRRSPMSVAEVLRIGIQVAGAVETAHRAGILHRDIKPANILVTEYNRPALTDFGISATTSADPSEKDEAEGMSIPWSPPESFAEPPRSGVGTDVWALAATVYTLLAGRSPFEVPGGRNSGADLIARIERAPLAPIGRSDVPASLERVLTTAMAKSPAARYPSALALARALQQVQIELSLATTPVDVLDDAAGRETGGDREDEDDDDPGTRIRQLVSIDPLGVTGSAGTARPVPPVPVVGATGQVRQVPPPADLDESTQIRSGAAGPSPFSGPLPTVPAGPAGAVAASRAGAFAPSAPVVEHTVQRAPAAAAPDAQVTAEAEVERRSRRPWVTALVAGVLVVVVGAVAYTVLGGRDSTPKGPAAEPGASAEPVDPIVTQVAGPAGLAGVVDGAQVRFTWTNPAPQEGDTYLWRTVSVLETGEYAQVSEPQVAVPTNGGQVCVEVVVRRASGRASDAAKACAP